jgi:hypothetical protein
LRSQPNAGRLQGNDGASHVIRHQGEDCDHEKRQDRLRPPQSRAAILDQRIEEVGEDDSDRYGIRSVE